MLYDGKIYHFVTERHDIIWYVINNYVLGCNIITVIVSKFIDNPLSKRHIICSKAAYDYTVYEKYNMQEISLIDAVENFKNWQVPENTIIEFLKRIEDA